MKILLMGLPGSGKSTLAEPFAKLVGGVCGKQCV
jgi:adenylate kinase family enzyme